MAVHSADKLSFDHILPWVYRDVLVHSHSYILSLLSIGENVSQEAASVTSLQFQYLEAAEDIQRSVVGIG